MCVTVTVNATEAPRPSEAELIRRLRRDAGRRPHCHKCGWPYTACDAGILRRRMCATCEAIWLDRRIRRMIRRMGRKGAIQALRDLAPMSKSK